MLLHGLAAAAVVCAAPMAFAATGNVAGWVKSAKLTGAAPSTRSVLIAVHMTLRDAAGLKTLATEVSTPSSKQYGRYLTTEEFDQRFSVASADVNAVKSMLEKAGMTEVAVGPHGAYVEARATVAQIRTAFKVSQDLYSYKGLSLRANHEEPTLPATLSKSVLFVEGLDDTSLLRKPYHTSANKGALVAPAAASTSTVTPPPVAAGNPSPYCSENFGNEVKVANLSTAADVYGAAIPWLNCGYTPAQIQNAYGLDKVKFTGTGVTVAIVDAYASPTLLADSNRYAARHGLPKLVLGENFSQIIPSGIYSVSPTETCGPYGWWTEESLDMAAVHGTATGAHILYIGARDCATSLDLALDNALYNHLADVVTNSYGFNGEAIATGQQASDDQAFMAGAVQGTTVLFSSGDDGDLSQDNGVASGAWPATSAFVTGVGGTSLLITNQVLGLKEEYGWGTYRAFLADAKVNSAKSVTTSGVTQITAFGATFDDYSFYSGSGGGISLLEAQPAYQKAAVPAYLTTSLNLASGYVTPLPNAQRVSPDVAMDADPYTGYLYGETFTIAGDANLDSGCTKISATEEYCEDGEGGTSLSSPLMAGVIAVMNQSRHAKGEAPVGFANPLLYSIGSKKNVEYHMALNQITAPRKPLSVLRGYKTNLTEVRVVTINSVPFFISTTTPFALNVCGLAICEGLDDVFNVTSLTPDAVPPAPAGYNDVTGLGTPWVPTLLGEE